MSLFDGNSVFNNLSAAHFGPVANCIWDASISGFRPQTTSDLATSSSTTSTGTATYKTFNNPTNYNVSGSPSGIGTALSSNSTRKILFVQNIGINPLYVKFGAAGASDSSMNMILGAGSASGDGHGASFLDNLGQITGLVSVSGIQANYIIWEA